MPTGRPTGSCLRGFGGGTSPECVSKKKCEDVDKPDQFGIEIAFESIPAESKPVYLNGGNLVVR